MESTVLGVFEDLKLKISESYKQNWSSPAKLRQPTGQSQENFTFGPSLLNFKLKVLEYPRNCRLHATLILKVQKNPESANVPISVGKLRSIWPCLSLLISDVFYEPLKKGVDLKEKTLRNLEKYLHVCIPIRHLTPQLELLCHCIQIWKHQ